MPGWKHDLSIPPNAAVQLYDSELIAVGLEGASLVLDLRAYVHRSHGIPGTDPGAILLQPAAITLPNGQLLDLGPDLPCTIDEGEISAGDHDFDGLIPCPFSCEDATRVNLTSSSGQTLRIDADQIRILFTGDPEFVGDFDGN
jgi:hypothetical protein